MAKFKVDPQLSVKQTLLVKKNRILVRHTNIFEREAGDDQDRKGRCGAADKWGKGRFL